LAAARLGRVGLASLPLAARAGGSRGGRGSRGRGGGAVVAARLGLGLPSQHLAARVGAVWYLKLLHSRGTSEVSVDERDRNGSTPLMHACEVKQAGAANYLLNMGADPQKKNAFGWTATLYAISGPAGGEGRKRALVDLLREEGGTLEWAPVKGKEGLAGVLIPAEGRAEGEEGGAASPGPGQRAALLLARWREGLAAGGRVRAGGLAVVGVSSRMLGLFDGQLYRVERLYYRQDGPFSPGEQQVEVETIECPPPPRAQMPAEVGSSQLNLPRASGHRGGRLRYKSRLLGSGPCSRRPWERSQ